MREVVCISTSNFYPFPTRKQNVMRRLRDAKIIYIDPPITLIAPLKDKSTLSRLTAYRKDGKRVKDNDNIIVYAPPPVLPFFNKYRWINKINQRRLARYINKILKRQGFVKPYLWCYTPTACDLIDNIDNSGVIYDCVDRHSAYQGMINPAVVDKMEENLAHAADMVFCTAAGLEKTLREYNRRTKMIANGANYPLFSQAATFTPPDKRAKPVFGFVGMLQECIAYDYIEALAESLPSAEIVFVGRVMPGVDISQMKKYKNIKFLGLQPQEKLPEIISGFDVCLNVFRSGRLALDVSPLKLYEYLATGKPIVSTEEPLQVRDFADVVYIAESRSDFVAKCREALTEDDQQKRWKRQKYGKACSWDNRVRQMEDELERLGIFK